MSIFYLSLLGLYAFILGGFFVKRIFPKEIDAKTLTVVTVYFLQPMLAFWGFTKAPLSLEILKAGVFFLLICVLVLGISALLFFRVPNKERVLYIFTGTNGNTGNMGIPLASIFFGPVGVVTATMINVFNIFWNVTFGVYFFARGTFSIKKSLLQIFTMPLLWAGILGIVLNLNEVVFPEKIQTILEMGAHASIVLQLFLLGVFWAGVPLKQFSLGLNAWLNIQKFMLLPFLGFICFWLLGKSLLSDYFTFSETVKSVILLQLMVPMAVSNANLATLYNVLPVKVSEGVLSTTVLFLLLAPLFLGFITS